MYILTEETSPVVTLSSSVFQKLFSQFAEKMGSKIKSYEQK